MPRKIASGDVVSRIWSLYGANARVLLPAAMVLYAIELVIALALPTALAVVLTLVFWILALVYQGFVVEVVGQARIGAPVGSQGDLIRAVVPALGSLVLISILFAIGITIGFILIIVPGLILLTIWSVVVPVEVLEHRGVIGSFGRSRELVRGNGWGVFGVIVLVYIAVIIISLVVGLIAASLGHVGRDLVQWLVNVAMAPVVALSASVLYFDLLDAHGG